MTGFEVELVARLLQVLGAAMLGLNVVVQAIALILGTYALYGCIMNMKRVEETVGLTREMKILGYPLLVIGLVGDALVNLIVASVIFLELPAARPLRLPQSWNRAGLKAWAIECFKSVEWLLTSRLIRHKQNALLEEAIDGKVSWRGRLARWLCSTLLDRLDPSGCHCRTK